MQFSRWSVLFVLTVILLFALVSFSLTSGTGLLHKISTNNQLGRVLDQVQAAAGARESLVFVGDIMLARDVERRLVTQAVDSPFSAAKDLLQAKVVVGNFEAAIPKAHIPTPNLTMRFSVAKEVLPALVKSGVTHLSLANNHTLDYGEAAYVNTVEQLGLRGFVAFGHPDEVTKSSVQKIELAGRQVAIVAVNGTYNYPDPVEVLAVLANTLTETELQIVYIHWGDEYELTHNQAQETLAHTLIDGGVDLVVGHHPHVVQDIENYRDGLIFYSLGNFVFDQYFSEEVQEGLVLDMGHNSTGWQVELIPVESHTVKVQPRKMMFSEKEQFLANLAKQSDKALAESILSGVIQLPR